jgi:iron complex transport system substrate-binding protein
MRVRTRDAELSSKEIDDRVRAVRGAGESLYVLDLPLLRSLSPEVILTQDLCRVCSVTDDEVRAACHVAGISPQIVSLSPTRLQEVWESIETIGSAVGAGVQGTRLASELRRRTSSDPSGTIPPRVAVVEWLDPPITSGLWTPDSVRAAGGESWLAEAGQPGRRTDWSTLASSAPDLVILSPCSFSVERTQRELSDERLLHDVSRLHPPRGVWLADEAYFSRPGPRLADGVALLRALLRGEAPPTLLPVERWVEAVMGAAQ